MNLLKPIDLNKLLSGKEQETVEENKTLTAEDSLNILREENDIQG